MTPTSERIAFSNSIRLDARQWLWVSAFTIAFSVTLPWLWKHYEAFSPTIDYRLPRDLNNDYWFFETYASEAASSDDMLVVGDSVIWGEFVAKNHTLSHYLNQQVGAKRFANLGLNGVHPLALEGLIEYYGRGIAGKKVLVHCNPTWLRELKTDLQDPDAAVNHPRLLPQFTGKPRAYRADISERISVLAERGMSLLKWNNHLQQAYYRTDGPNDIPTWTLKHPYRNPLAPLSQALPASDDAPHADARPWRKRGLSVDDATWVDLEQSLQWPAFQRTVELLQRRGNRVFVLVGPLNDHMLAPASKTRYDHVKRTITDWLTAREVPFHAPSALPGELYADVSHPLAAGYERLSQELLKDGKFTRWMD